MIDRATGIETYRRARCPNTGQRTWTVLIPRENPDDPPEFRAEMYAPSEREALERGVEILNGRS